jgi:uncharacterized protein HemY
MDTIDDNLSRQWQPRVLREIGTRRVKDPVQRQRKADKVTTARPTNEQLAASGDWSAVIERQRELCKQKSEVE